jgi:hypothetical protein
LRDLRIAKFHYHKLTSKNRSLGERRKTCLGVFPAGFFFNANVYNNHLMTFHEDDKLPLFLRSQYYLGNGHK